ncbi:PREDICTED: rho guanine nucleotide exchange factor 8-like [Nicotiana attenuata]|uniref:Rho guanine nucleotide exchange factor 8 n=1 Tax=Nicotiana attenuata TaxID=49451 RepID=A0A1J6IB17_NICAT|nr:PREDICTED: rho guanine nucleotide exchange factor 8-like [Nicotiana attenuata]OIT01636.1 rho guanine nucleotide exchange factor 8 [Nicotiana attenuata]
MVREIYKIHKSKSFNFRKMFEGRQAHSVVLENGHGREAMDFRSQGGKSSSALLEKQHIGSVFNRSVNPISRFAKEGARSGNIHKDKHSSDMEMMKERFAKLLLGEDMSGGGKGVSSALALSNAITNLAASVFGEQWKLEPMSQERKARWRKEIDWLLSVSDYIVEFVPSQQKSKDGTNMEVMVTQQRRDLLMNIPALKKLDAMLIDCLENFKYENEFWYVSRDADESEKGVQRNDKWWLPTVKVPPEGLSDTCRKWLQYQKDCVNQVHKASMAINAQILSEMEIPENYMESLPKNGRESLGDSIYKNITVEFFDPEQFLSTNMDLSTEHKVLDLKNRIEASVVIWKRKMHHKDGKSSWGSAVSLEKRELFEERAETILLLLKQRFPGIPQSSLDISKIQYNNDIGHSILESYSRVLESLANTVMSRIEDVLYADSLTQDPSFAIANQNLSADSSPPLPLSGVSTPKELEAEVLSSTAQTPSSRTLFDFIGWNVELGETGMKKNHSTGNLEAYFKGENDYKSMTKLANITPKKFSYIEKIESGLRSPTARD